MDPCTVKFTRLEKEVFRKKPVTCIRCGLELPLKVLHSAAGYYVGRQCPGCGPYDRISGYCKTKNDAEIAMDLFTEDKVN
jgi:hypothetical protein